MAEIITMPKLGFDMAEGTLVRWVIGEGESVTKGAVLAEIETDKATVEVEATASGILLRQLVEQGSVVPVNTPIAVIGQPGEPVPIEAKKGLGEKTPTETEKGRVSQPSQQIPNPVEMPTALQEVRASPLARRLAREAGIELGQIKGSGPQGRITKVDVEAFLASKGHIAPETVAPSLVSAPISPATFTPGIDQHIPLSKLRSIIGKRMVQSIQKVPHFYVTHEVDVENLM
ncbi:MAG: E3 binding domain-containing protein, partial [Anaerolineales bacterium]